MMRKHDPCSWTAAQYARNTLRLENIRTLHGWPDSMRVIKLTGNVNPTFDTPWPVLDATPGPGRLYNTLPAARQQSSKGAGRRLPNAR